MGLYWLVSGEVGGCVQAGMEHGGFILADMRCSEFVLAGIR